MKRFIITLCLLAMSAVVAYGQDTSPTPTHFRMLDLTNGKFTLTPVDSFTKKTRMDSLITAVSRLIHFNADSAAVDSNFVMKLNAWARNNLDIGDTLIVGKIADIDTIYSSTTVTLIKDNLTVSDTLVVNKIADIDTLWSSLNKIYVKTALQVKDSILIGNVNILTMVSDSIAAHPGGATPYQTSTLTITLTGKGGNFTGNTNQLDSLYKIAADSLVVLGGGTIEIKGAFIESDSMIPRSNIAVVGNPETTSIAATGDSKYLWVDTLATGTVKNFRIEGITFIGTDSAFGIYKAETRSDSLVFRLNEVRGFTDVGATIFASDTLSTAWVVEHNRFRNNRMVLFKGQKSTFADNSFRNHTRQGLVVNTNGNVVSNNVFWGCDSASVMAEYYSSNGFAGSTGLVISGNTINWPDSSYHIGILVNGSTTTNRNVFNFSITNNRINDQQTLNKKILNAGIVLTGTYSLGPGIISNNIIYGTATYGIYLNVVDNVNVVGNTVLTGITGIYIIGGGENGFSNNYYSNMTTGLHVAGGTKNTFFAEIMRSCATNVTDAGTGTISAVTSGVRDVN